MTESFRSLRIGEEGPVAACAHRHRSGGVDSLGNHPADLCQHRACTRGVNYCTSQSHEREKYIITQICLHLYTIEICTVLYFYLHKKFICI